MTIIVIMGWLICSVLGNGLSFAYFQRSFTSTAKKDYWNDFRLCLTISMFGPIALASTIILFGTKKGFKLY